MSALAAFELEGRLFDPKPYKDRLNLVDSERAVGNVLQLYDQASSRELEAGRAWYDQAHQYCRQLHEQYSESLDGDGDTLQLTLEQIVGIVAASSPMTSWEDNQQVAERVLFHGIGGGLGYADRDAFRLKSGVSVDEVLLDPKRTNYKVSAFFHNIMYPYWSGPVTVDRHMWAVLHGIPRSNDRRLADYSKEDYLAAEEVFRTAAKQADLMPHQMQAVCWGVRRRLAGRSGHNSSGVVVAQLFETR